MYIYIYKYGEITEQIMMKKKCAFVQVCMHVCNMCVYIYIHIYTYIYIYMYVCINMEKSQSKL